MNNIRMLCLMTLSAIVLALPPTARAQTDASALSTLSALPVASLLVGGSAVAGAVLVLPAALSTAGAVLVVKTVESTARGTICVLERVSDGARVSLAIGGALANGVSLAVGTAVTVSVISTGVILSALGEVVAFLPNTLGAALLHNERLTN